MEAGHDVLALTDRYSPLIPPGATVRYVRGAGEEQDWNHFKPGTVIVASRPTMAGEVFRIAGNVGARRFILLSHDTIYAGTKAGQALDESALRSPASRRGWHVLAAEDSLAMRARALPGTSGTSLRLPLVYGENPGTSGVRLSRGRPSEPALAAHREYLHAADMATAVLAVMRAENPGPVYNAGTGTRRVADQLSLNGGEPLLIERRPSDGHANSPYPALASERARAELGWEPIHSLRAAGLTAARR
jgi:nucleoside-diphosphate-sugar epimerase